jgi:hypothetical protein
MKDVTSVRDVDFWTIIAETSADVGTYMNTTHFHDLQNQQNHVLHEQIRFKFGSWRSRSSGLHCLVLAFTGAGRALWVDSGNCYIK